MNADRVTRRIRLLCEMFYELHANHHAKPAPKPSERDIAVMAALMEREEATFGEVKAVLAFVFVHDVSQRWAANLDGRVQSFANGYRQMCDATDKHIVRNGTPTTGRAATVGDTPRARLLPLTDEERASIEALAEDPTPTLEESDMDPHIAQLAARAAARAAGAAL